MLRIAHERRGKTTMIPIDDETGCVAFVLGRHCDAAQNEALARKIVAADAMLAALKAVADLKGWDHEPPVAATGIQVMAAIAKAEKL